MFFKPISQALCKFQKKISLVRSIANQAANHHKFREVEIRVPWGKICGKYWGPQDVQPIIAIHGVGDNAGSFDPLAMRLPENVSLFAPDLPGHGLSSWIPRGMQYTILSSVQILYRVKEHFKMDKLKLIGHSISGITSFMYSAINPDGVKYVIAFDVYKPLLFTLDVLPLIHYYQETHIWNEKLFEPKIKYSYENAIKTMIELSKNSLDVASSKILIDRGMTRQPDGTLCLNEDPRVKLFSLDLTATTDYTKMLAQNIHCPYMLIKGDYFSRTDRMNHYFDALKVIEESSADFQHHTISGTHHFHMRNSEKIASLINPFILKHAD